jgi:hypothetical protein
MQNAAVHRSDSDDEYNLRGLSSESDSDDDDNDDVDDKEPFCAGCDRWFVSLESLYKHLAASLKHNWCFVCSRDFASPSSLQQVSPALAPCFIY